MGTQGPLVRIDAATLAGGANNQDRYAYGDGWAFVLDGASSFSEQPPVHDGGWYAERLKNALVEQLTKNPSTATTEIVSRAIQEASAAHDKVTQGICPTSTLAIARWDPAALELYMLGDSYGAVFRDGSAEPELLSDDRLASIGLDLREQYRSRLAQGYGFDATHREILAKLQGEELKARNRTGGYWIAGDEPAAATHAVSRCTPMHEISSVLLFSDGVAPRGRALSEMCTALRHGSLRDHLQQMHDVEAGDSEAVRYPRSKLHDDKTVMCLRFG